MAHGVFGLGRNSFNEKDIVESNTNSGSLINIILVIAIIMLLGLLFFVTGIFNNINTTSHKTRHFTSNNTNHKVNHSSNWATLANNIKIDYQGKITAIEQLNGTTCWVIIRNDLPNSDAISVAENVGYYVKNNTGERPSVHVFRDGRHISVARFYSNKYKGKIDIGNWDPSAFNGQYRP